MVYYHLEVKSDNSKTMLSQRQEQLLDRIIVEYVKTAEPVGSQFLVEECKLDVSPATVRNEMRSLEELGFLTHPHTSSGRIPTETGYRYYIEHIMQVDPLAKKEHDAIRACFADSDDKQSAVKQTAKYIAEHVSNAVIIAFGQHTLYYTGMSYLFAQPEFRDVSYMIEASSVFDQFEDRIPYVFDMFASGDTRIFVGSQNPLGQKTSIIATRVDDMWYAILSPLRVDYARAYAFVSDIHSCL